MIQDFVVGLIVIVALAYAIWKFTPMVLRERAAPHLVRIGRRLGLSPVDALRLESKLVSGGACGSCNSCNACATDPEVLTEASISPVRPESAAHAKRVIPIRSRNP